MILASGEARKLHIRVYYTCTSKEVEIAEARAIEAVGIMGGKEFWAARYCWESIDEFVLKRQARGRRRDSKQNGRLTPFQLGHYFKSGYR
jgi:hypothetical protein